MKPLKKYTIIGILIVLITGTLSHYIYDWSGQNVFVGFFFPVNESIWEHMKLVFFPMLIYSLFLSRQTKHENPCVTPALYLGTLTGTLLIPVIFYTYSGILGYNLLILDLLTFLLSVLTGFLISYKAAENCAFTKYGRLLKIAVFLMAITFFLFTYLPPAIGFFAIPTMTAYPNGIFL